MRTIIIITFVVISYFDFLFRLCTPRSVHNRTVEVHFLPGNQSKVVIKIIISRSTSPA